MNRSALTCLLAATVALTAGCAGYGPSAGVKMGLFFGVETSAHLKAHMYDPDAETRRWAVICLARRGDLSVVPAVTELLSPQAEPSPLVRATAASCLRMLGDKRALPALRDACDDVHPLTRADAARAVGALGDSSDSPLLARLLARDSSPEVRLEAALALKKIGNAEATPALIAALGDADESVAFQSHAALVRLTGQEMPPLRRAWEAWRKDPRPAVNPSP